MYPTSSSNGNADRPRRLAAPVSILGPRSNRGEPPMTPEALREETERLRRADQAAIRAENAARRQRQIEATLRGAGVGARFLGATFGNCERVARGHPDILARVRRWAEDFEATKARGSNLAILGAVGTGKTWIAAAALREVASQGGTVAYLREDDLLRHLRRSYSPAAEVDEGQALAALTEPDLLCIDEAGKGIGKPDTRRAQLGAVIDARYRAMRPVLMLSNLTAAELAIHLGTDAWDRLTGADSQSAVLTMRGPSLRQSPGGSA